MRRAGFVAALALLVGATGAAASPVTDCPLAHQRYSADTPVIDLLIDPRTAQVLRDAGVLAKLPIPLKRTTAPSFGAIVSLRLMERLGWLPAGTSAELDPRLSPLAIRPGDVIARCARYADDGHGPLSDPGGRPALLVFEKINGFRDDPSVSAASAAFRRTAEERGWHVVFTDRNTAFTPAYLKRFDAVAWNNVSGDVLTVPQRRAFRRYVEGGGGFVGIHGSGGDPASWWDWYVNTLIGARFAGHPDTHQTAKLVVEGASDITAGIAPNWALKEEWYSFVRSPRETGARVLLSVDETSYRPNDGKRDIAMGDHPVAWTRCVGRGRSFYSALGHRPEVYADARNERLMAQGLVWAMSKGVPCAGADGKPVR